jgi:hypothetical protein
MKKAIFSILFVLFFTSSSFADGRGFHYRDGGIPRPLERGWDSSRGIVNDEIQLAASVRGHFRDSDGDGFKETYVRPHSRRDPSSVGSPGPFNP